MKLPNWVIPGSAVFFLGACALLESPIESASRIATEGDFSPVQLPDWRLRGFAKRLSAASTVRQVTIYLESDGAPWRMPDEPPHDPTPQRPMVLRMAIDDAADAVAYLGRPCQYLAPEQLARCDPALWMRGRFGEDAVAAIDTAVTRIKSRYGASGVNLVGYSGGGAMAALVAARRRDVGCLVTIAAPLDTDAWTAAINVSSLSYSLNPADAAHKLASLPQTHFRGGNDRLVPTPTARRFLQRTPGAVVIDIDRYDHQCCWGDDWKGLMGASCLNR